VCVCVCVLKPSVICHINPLNTELNPICHLLALLEAHHILHVSRIKVNYCGIADISDKVSSFTLVV